MRRVVIDEDEEEPQSSSAHTPITSGRRRRKGKVSTAAKARQQSKRNQLRKSESLSDSISLSSNSTSTSINATPISSIARKRRADSLISDLDSLVLDTPKPPKKGRIIETKIMPPPKIIPSRLQRTNSLNMPQVQSVQNFEINENMIPILISPEAHIAHHANAHPGQNGDFFREMMGENAFFDDSYIYAFLCLLAHNSNRRITVVSPVFSNLEAQGQIRMSADDNSFNYTLDTEIIFLPVHFGGHWALVIHERGGRSYFIDSIPSDLFENRLYDTNYVLYDPFRIRLLHDALHSLVPDLPDNHAIEVIPADQLTPQVDGHSCGLFVCLYAESFLLNRSYILPNLNINEERKRILWHIKHLFETDDVEYLPRNEILNPNVNSIEENSEIVTEQDQILMTSVRRSKRIAGKSQAIDFRNLHIHGKTTPTSAIWHDDSRIRANQRKWNKTFTKKKKINMNCDGISHMGWGCGSLIALEKGCPSRDPKVYNVGSFTKRCEHCDALLLEGENSTQCCAGGKIKVEPQVLAPLPLELLKSPENVTHPNTKDFKANATLYNTMLQYASVTYHEKASAVPRQPPVCKINGMSTHQIGPLRPGPNQLPAFQGLYVTNPEQAEEYRKKILEKTGMADKDGDPLGRISMELLKILDEMIRQENPIARDLKKGFDYFKEIEEKAKTEGKEPPKVEMRLLNNREVPDNIRDPTVHPHRLNHTDNPLEVSAIWRTDEDGLPDMKGTMIQMHGPGLRKLEHFDPNVPPLCYPLIHPRGEQYYHSGIKLEIGEAHTDGNNEDMEIENLQGTLDTTAPKKGKRKFASRRQMIRHFTHIRPKTKTSSADPRIDHPLWGCRKLAQKWLLDQVWNMENEEADYIKREVQKDKLRWELPEKFLEGIRKGLKPNQTLGNVFKVPKTWKGSPAHMQLAYQKSMAIFRRRGKPTFMVTFTGNPKWKEIVEGIYQDGQIMADRPDIMCRVFEQKVKEARKDLEEIGVLGKCNAHVECREFQDKGCPHFHKLITIDESSLPEGIRLNSAEFVDQYISAEIPPLPTDEDWENRRDWAEREKRYHDLVKKFMIHSCTEDSICRKGGRCSKGFPKQFSDVTIVTDNRPPIYRRRNNGVTVQKRAGNAMKEFDNRYVVPHNRYMLEKNECHVNVEKVWGLGAGKYALKYVTKGREQAYVLARIQQNNQNQTNQPQVVDFDEFQQIFQTSYMTPQESYTRLTSVPIIRLSETVIPLSVHKPAGQAIVFQERREEEAAERAIKPKKHSKFTAYMFLCEDDEIAREMTYEQIPEKYVWHKDHKNPEGKEGVWEKEKRERGGVIGSIYNVFPSDPELFAIRLLAIHRKGYTTFDELKTIDGEVCGSFVECARRLGLIDDIEIWRATMDEACKHLFDKRLWRFFAQLVLFSCQIHARMLFDEFFPQMVRNTSSIHERQRCLRYIAYIFAEANRSMKDFDLAEPLNYNPQENLDEFFFGDVQTGPQSKGDQMYSQLNPEQKNVIDTLEKTAAQIRANPGDPTIQRLWIINASGGFGKTYTIETQIQRARSSKDTNKLKVMTTASTGIAASNMTGATTLHSAFRLPLSKGANTIPNVAWEALHGQRIRSAEILIIDEVSMIESRLIDMVDKSCRDLEPNPQKKKLPFGGKIVLISGDWKQLLPVIKGKSIKQQALASFRTSEKYKLFKEFKLTQNMRMTAGQEEYKRFIEAVGLGTNFIVKNGFQTERVEIPAEMNTVFSLQSLLEQVFPQTICTQATSKNREEQAQFAQNVILSTTNQVVNLFNEQILDRIPGQSRTFLSIDKPIAGNPLDVVYDADRQPENLNQINTGGLPLHKLRIKKGSVVMLLRNLSVANGLCNGTRMIVDEMTDNLIWCRRLNSSGQLDEERVAIARFNFDYDDSEHEKTGIKFNRVQFPLKLASALTINKAQGQTIPGKLGIDLSEDVFSAGMLYVALSRTRDARNVTILTKPSSERPSVKNIVYDFDNPERFTRPEPAPIQFPEVDLTDDEDNDNAAFDFNVGAGMIAEIEVVNVVSNSFDFGSGAVEQQMEVGNEPGVPFSFFEENVEQMEANDQAIEPEEAFDFGVEQESDVEGNEMDIEKRREEQIELENYGQSEIRELTQEEQEALNDYLNERSEGESEDGPDIAD